MQRSFPLLSTVLHTIIMEAQKKLFKLPQQNLLWILIYTRLLKIIQFSIWVFLKYQTVTGS